jgi:hypothetical protein
VHIVLSRIIFCSWCSVVRLVYKRDVPASQYIEVPKLSFENIFLSRCSILQHLPCGKILIVNGVLLGLLFLYGRDIYCYRRIAKVQDMSKGVNI